MDSAGPSMLLDALGGADKVCGCACAAVLAVLCSGCCAVQFFPGHKHLDYALKVEEYTLQKAANLVLNVDGCIAGETDSSSASCSGLCCSQPGHIWDVFDDNELDRQASRAVSMNLTGRHAGYSVAELQNKKHEDESYHCYVV